MTGIVLFLAGLASGTVGFWHVIWRVPSRGWRAFAPALTLILLGWPLMTFGLLFFFAEHQ